MEMILQNFKNTLTYRVFRHIVTQWLETLSTVGWIGINFISALKAILTFEINLKNTFEQFSKFGFDSLPITLSMVGLSGMIIALQLAYEMVKQGAGDYVGALVTVSIVREIGPIMASFGIISMVGSSMAAEIGTMKVTEQVDAIKVLGINPITHLIVPRILAGFITMPFVIILANTVGILGGLFTSHLVSNLNLVKYIDSVWHGLAEKDIWVSLLKGSIFGGVIALISSSIGYETKGGAIDVGKATTKAVVWSFTTVVILDYIISLMFFD